MLEHLPQRPMSIEDYEWINRANFIVEMGLQQLQEKEGET